MLDEDILYVMVLICFQLEFQRGPFEIQQFSIFIFPRKSQTNVYPQRQCHAARDVGLLRNHCFRTGCLGLKTKLKDLKVFRSEDFLFSTWNQNEWNN